MPLERPVEILKFIASADGAPTLTELHDGLGLPKATLHRLLSELVQHRLLRVDPRTKGYSLGGMLLELAFATWEGSDIRKLAEPYLADLKQQVNETIHLAVPEDSGITYIDKLEARDHMRIFSAIGKRAPLYCTGVGKAILGTMSTAELKKALDGVDLTPHTTNTLTTQAALIGSVRELNTYGYVLDMEEHEIGIRCVAAPVLNFRGEALAGLSVTGPAARMGLDRLRSIGPLVSDCAAKISKELGCMLYPYGTTGKSGDGRLVEEVRSEPR